jgi:predicted RNA-binding Zn-ribbon protein involved in translation (DUF1610 family)
MRWNFIAIKEVHDMETDVLCPDCGEYLTDDNPEDEAGDNLIYCPKCGFISSKMTRD